jgi:hypothetical protein
MIERSWPTYDWKEDTFNPVSFLCRSCVEYINLTLDQIAAHDTHKDIAWDMNQILCLMDDHECELVDWRLPKGVRTSVRV